MPTPKLPNAFLVFYPAIAQVSDAAAPPATTGSRNRSGPMPSSASLKRSPPTNLRRNWPLPDSRSQPTLAALPAFTASWDRASMYATTGLYSNAFFLSGGHYKLLDSPSATHSSGNGAKCFAVNDDGTAACDYLTQPDALQFTHGFLNDDGKMTSIFVHGSEKGGFGRQVNGINNGKKVVGTFTISEARS